MNKAQTIFRIEKNPNNPYVMIDKRPIENKDLSWKAKGLLAYLLSRPDNWTIRFRDLVSRSTDAASSVRSAMKELRNAGHVKIVVEREAGKVKQWIYTVHEVPDLSVRQLRKEKELKPKANSYPELIVYKSIVKRYPATANWDDVIKSIKAAAKRLGKEVSDIQGELNQIYKQWTSKGYNPFNLAWLEWAETGVIPSNGTWKPRNANYQASHQKDEYTAAEIALGEQLRKERARV